jgi:copper transport protein
MDTLITWLTRSLHVLGAAVWIGGYAVLALAIVPALAREPSDALRRLALATVRLVSFAGGLTILAGLVLVARSRGYASLLTGGEWGLNIISAAVIAVILMGIGDSGLRPALRRLDPDSPGSASAARRWAVTGLVLTILALAVMTRALYARS